MDIEEMIAVLEAAKRGEKIEVANVCGEWTEVTFGNLPNYRIAPKKEMTLVELARLHGENDNFGKLFTKLADRIEFLERIPILAASNLTTDELLDEVKWRMK